MKKPVKEAEQELGSTAEEVAAKLAQEGIKGLRRSPCNCPIAIYFKRHCELWPGAYFDAGRIYHLDPQILDYNFQPPVTELMIRFDAGEFNELAFV